MFKYVTAVHLVNSQNETALEALKMYYNIYKYSLMY